MRNKAILSLSGGSDSSTLLYKILNDREIDEIYVVSLDYSQRHRKELEYARDHVEYLKKNHSFGNKIKDHKFFQIDLRQFGNKSVLVSDNPVQDQSADQQASTVVPYRNTLFTILIASQAKAVGANRIFLGPVKIDYDIYADCRPEFFESLQQTLRLSSDIPDLVIETPFIQWNKWDIVKLGSQLGLDYSKTWTCYRGELEPCGTCDSCQERVQSFYEAGLVDPVFSQRRWNEVVDIYLNSSLHKSLVGVS